MATSRPGRISRKSHFRPCRPYQEVRRFRTSREPVAGFQFHDHALAGFNLFAHAPGKSQSGKPSRVAPFRPDSTRVKPEGIWPTLSSFASPRDLLDPRPAPELFYAGTARSAPRHRVAPRGFSDLQSDPFHRGRRESDTPGRGNVKASVSARTGWPSRVRRPPSGQSRGPSHRARRSHPERRTSGTGICLSS